MGEGELCLFLKIRQNIGREGVEKLAVAALTQNKVALQVIFLPNFNAVPYSA